MIYLNYNYYKRKAFTRIYPKEIKAYLHTKTLKQIFYLERAKRKKVYKYN